MLAAGIIELYRRSSGRQASCAAEPPFENSPQHLRTFPEVPQRTSEAAQQGFPLLSFFVPVSRPYTKNAKANAAVPARNPPI
jgi:hypothetical protein